MLRQKKSRALAWELGSRVGLLVHMQKQLQALVACSGNLGVNITFLSQGIYYALLSSFEETHFFPIFLSKEAILEQT